MHSFFKNAVGKKEVLNFYYKKLDTLNFEVDFITVETSFGDTNIITTKNNNLTPLVLVHGLYSCAPFALDNFKALEQNFKVYAIDILGQPNISDEIRLNSKSNEYGKWMYEIISRLHLFNVYLVGYSLGGYIAYKTLAYEESRIAKAFLISPTGFVKGSIIKLFFSIYVPLKLYKWKQDSKQLAVIVNALSTEKDAFNLHFLSKLIANYKFDFLPLAKVKKKEAKRITTPIYIFAAVKDIVVPGNKLIQKAKKILPSLESVLLLKEGKNQFNTEDKNMITAHILESILKTKE
ncbi:alpha/beta hydrolase [Polaribacter ponticola]|uniref:Alpha/beta fold hydrolase n=1 Tax=Polaribacter ponticola TaxID=2978475 RepID=A0ABT5S6A8_9FLAO|nr:alpha/beta fold hydrolase [Polaribacter sp. MSW5]MDD7913634.1 alpha/beta fold hydrolase [Polaribacter sp. MSW5]